MIGAHAQPFTFVMLLDGPHVGRRWCLNAHCPPAEGTEVVVEFVEADQFASISTPQLRVEGLEDAPYEVDAGSFLSDNAEDAEIVDAICRLENGAVAEFGGGASPRVRIERCDHRAVPERAEPPTAKLARRIVEILRSDDVNEVAALLRVAYEEAGHVVTVEAWIGHASIGDPEEDGLYAELTHGENGWEVTEPEGLTLADLAHVGARS